MSYTGSKAQIGSGTRVSIGPRTDAGGAATYTHLGEVRDTSSSGAKWGTVDVTNFDSGTEAEGKKSIRNNGTKTLTLARVSSDAGQVALTAAYNDQTGTYMFKVEYPLAEGQNTTGDTDLFNALVVSFNTAITFEKDIMITVELDQQGPTATTLGS